MRLKNIITLVALFICLFIPFSGCTQKQITSPQDELVLYEWGKSDKFGKEISLSFADDTAQLKIKTTDFDYSIAGDVLIDNETIKIYDNNLKQSYSFNYVLYGDKIEITYNENTLELDKIT